ncbi:tetratricopeptide repeat protein [Trichlorobacter lovleyi]|uniref:tetratricopeptide repeat protein n=1 Tax=Trichlorobacter lovleyi TaxID=313985 RepID=UPI00223EE079|nr:tetratricopeptide repeat protein [Trichlorobacter lovleyi]QOX80328.1 tetratricopeptide repeat protein [Trichlorobacter lovleyi]
MSLHHNRGRAAAWYRLGTIKLNRNRLDEAADCFRQALAQAPGFAAGWHNLAHTYQKMQQHDEALICYRRALYCCPDDPCSLNNMGVLLRDMGRLDESLDLFERLITCHPTDGDGHWNRALSLLMAGDYATGWLEYEWRFQRTRPVPIFDPGTPRWQGEPLEGKTILLCCEQGYGDSIQFIRFAPLLADWGATVLVRCPDRSLADLLSGAPGIHQALIPGDQIPDHDFWSPLLSLPLHLAAIRENLPQPPYLFADSRSDLPDLSQDRLTIGLVWSGRSTDPYRACPARMLASLRRFVGQVSFFSLQLNAQESDLSLLQDLLKITDLSHLLVDFQATASIMAQLDLIICIDSAPAHLAGALGREVWLLAHHSPDWRWGLNRSDSDWYPTMRIFRQASPGLWERTVEDMVEALEHRLAGSSPNIPTSTAKDLIAIGDRLREQEQWSSACHCYRRAAEREPDNFLARLCTGGCLIFLNRPHEAADWFRQAIALQPDYPDAHINLGLALLSCGCHVEGWREFDWRCQRMLQHLPPIPCLPELDTDSTLTGKTVLIHTEQGYGDTLQFLRYLPTLAATGASIVISVPPHLVRLVSSMGGAIQVIAHGELLPQADFQLPLLSLPQRLSRRSLEISAASYLKADPMLRTDWQQRLAEAEHFKVGLVWRGSDLGKSGYRRALTTDLLAPFTWIDGVKLYSLQLGATAEELKQLPGIVDLTPHITDFSDTAAIMTTLDLVISVDTATAHLAGALGVRCWVPLLFSPDWRWYPLQEQGSCWYLTITAFRQTIPGRWEPVITAIASTLQGEALLYKGHQLGRLGKRKEAIAVFRKATELPDKNGPALLNLGIYLRADSELLLAKEALLKATEADPSYPEAWQNLGLVHQDLLELPEAYLCLKRALALRPDYATARWNFALLQLLLGDYTEGFRNFESRFTKLGAVARLHADIPAWDGANPAEKTILIHAEQGYGDTIQFVRYIPELIDAGAHVVLEVQDTKLRELCRSTSTFTQVIVRGDTLPQVNLQAPLLSLPHLLGSSIATIQRKIPYLSADKDKTALWKSRLPDDKRRKIGICWKGRPIPDPKRSIPFSELCSLWALPDVTWVSLQMEPDDAAELPDCMLDLTDKIRDFSDTAALMSCLDLVISIDSAVAHLAGALGMKAIILLPFSSDWRWTCDQEGTPWYPTLRLARQTSPQAWNTPIHTARNIIESGTLQ